MEGLDDDAGDVDGAGRAAEAAGGERGGELGDDAATVELELEQVGLDGDEVADAFELHIFRRAQQTPPPTARHRGTHRRSSCRYRAGQAGRPGRFLV